MVFLSAIWVVLLPYSLKAQEDFPVEPMPNTFRIVENYYLTLDYLADAKIVSEAEISCQNETLLVDLKPQRAMNFSEATNLDFNVEDKPNRLEVKNDQSENQTPNNANNVQSIPQSETQNNESKNSAPRANPIPEKILTAESISPPPPNEVPAEVHHLKSKLKKIPRPPKEPLSGGITRKTFFLELHSLKPWLENEKCPQAQKLIFKGTQGEPIEWELNKENRKLILTANENFDNQLNGKPPKGQKKHKQAPKTLSKGKPQDDPNKPKQGSPKAAQSNQKKVKATQ